ncbi:MAG: QueT transporter family protein [Acutalibacter sp.]|nr:QueT transporter family protein [Acutalibacter sp.]
MSTKSNARFLALSAVIAGLYAALTYAAAMLNLAYGPVQFRFSEALTVLPAFTPAAIPGLTVGCLLANLGSPLGVVDWVFGTAATLLAALGTAAVSRIRWKGLPLLAPLPPVIVNALVVGLEISCLNGAGAFTFSAFTAANFAYSALTVGLGELAVCLVLGLPLCVLLEKSGLRQALASARL